jgi:amino acid permease
MPPEPDTDPADDLRDGRDETPTERADRNWGDVLQELRVLQTGTQILTGFLLALAFQPAFADLSDGQRTFYLVLVVLAALSTIFALAPVALHRILFRRRLKARVVAYGHAALSTALVTVGALVVGVTAFVFDVVVSDPASLTVGIILGAVIAVLWIAVPVLMRGRSMEGSER